MDEETLQGVIKLYAKQLNSCREPNDILGCFIETKIPELVIKVDKEDIYQVCG